MTTVREVTVVPTAHGIGAVVAVLVVVVVWFVRLVRLGHSVVSHGRFWSESKGVPGGLVYVALGDSAAQGVGASRPELGYVGLLAERMRQRTGCEVLLVNLSVSGAKVRDVVDKQLPQLCSLRADLVTVAIGGNDVPFYDSAAFAAAVEEMTAGLPIGTYVADVPYYMHGRWERHAAQAATVLADSARSHRLHVVPLHEAERARGSRAMLTDFAADWFHPNDRGHRLWADTFWTSVATSPALSRGAS